MSNCSTSSTGEMHDGLSITLPLWERLTWNYTSNAKSELRRWHQNLIHGQWNCQLAQQLVKHLCTHGLYTSLVLQTVDHVQQQRSVSHGKGSCIQYRQGLDTPHLSASQNQSTHRKYTTMKRTKYCYKQQYKWVSQMFVKVSSQNPNQ